VTIVKFGRFHGFRFPGMLPARALFDDSITCIAHCSSKSYLSRCDTIGNDISLDVQIIDMLLGNDSLCSLEHTHGITQTAFFVLLRLVKNTVCST